MSDSEEPIDPKGGALDPSRLQRFRAMFDAHYAFVFRVLRRGGLDAAAAEDGAQQVFLVGMRRIDAIETGKEKAFLGATALRVAARMRDQRARRRETAADDEAPADGGGGGQAPPAADELVERKRQRELLDRILSEMDDDLRAVIVLAEVEGLGKRELAEALGIPEGTAASRLRRAREDFDARLHRLVAARRIP